MREHGKIWPLVLAAGDGARLQSLTTTAQGIAIPKQFWSLRGGPSLLQEALQRAAAIAPRDQVCVIVAEQHRRWWKKPLWSLPASNVIVQPDNRGTANGILWPLLHIIDRDPEARVVLLPSDHYVREEGVLAEALLQGISRLESRHSDVLLLGLEPEEADPELGYIVPGMSSGDRTFEVARFIEKPDEVLARQLVELGAMWNAFIAIARARELLRMFERNHADIVVKMRHAAQRGGRTQSDTLAVADLYQQLPKLDFSRDIVEGQEKKIRVLAVPSCGWCDLGTPGRVAATLRRIPSGASQPAAAASFAQLNLASQHARVHAERDQSSP